MQVLFFFLLFLSLRSLEVHVAPPPPPLPPVPPRGVTPFTSPKMIFPACHDFSHFQYSLHLLSSPSCAHFAQKALHAAVSRVCVCVVFLCMCFVGNIVDICLEKWCFFHGGGGRICRFLGCRCWRIYYFCYLYCLAQQPAAGTPPSPLPRSP